MFIECRSVFRELFMSNDEIELKEILRNVIRKQYPEVWNFLHKYLDQWMKREDWLEHEIILKVFCNDKLDYLEKQIQVANSVLININEFKNRTDRLHNQSYSQWEDWYAELRAIDLLNKKGYREFKYIKEESNKTPDFKAKRNDESVLIEVKHKHYSAEDGTFDKFDRKLCAESIRDEVLRKPFGSNFQENPKEFEKLLEFSNKWENFIEGLKESIKINEKYYNYDNRVKIDWLDDCGEFSLSDQLHKSLIPRPRFYIDKKVQKASRIIQQEKLYDVINVIVSKAIRQLKKYEKNISYSFDINCVICFVKLDTVVHLFQREEIGNALIPKLKNEIESNYQNTILEIVIE